MDTQQEPENFVRNTIIWSSAGYVPVAGPVLQQQSSDNWSS